MVGWVPARHGVAPDSLCQSRLKGVRVKQLRTVCLGGV